MHDSEYRRKAPPLLCTLFSLTTGWSRIGDFAQRALSTVSDMRETIVNEDLEIDVLACVTSMPEISIQGIANESGRSFATVARVLKKSIGYIRAFTRT